MKRRPELSAEGWVAKKPRSAAAKWLGRDGAPAEQRFERCVVVVPPPAGGGCGTEPALTVGAEQRAELCARAPGSSVRLPKKEAAMVKRAVVALVKTQPNRIQPRTDAH